MLYYEYNLKNNNLASEVMPMMLYIHALGFSEYDDKEKAEEIVNDIIKSPTKRFISNYKKDEIKVEYYKEYGENFGLLVRGTLSDKEELKVYSLIPYSLGSTITDTYEIDVMKGDKKDIFNAYCEEIKSGTPISFFLQNVVDYMQIDDKDDVYIDGVRLVAYSVDGTIILPIDKDEEDLILDDEEDLIREQLLEKAREGDEDALDLLEEEALEASEVLQDRLLTEDMLSVLEGFFVPIKESDDVFSILGDILDVKELINHYTKEEIYVLKVKCMNIKFDVYINKKDLIGMPSPGMRFKGTTWVHGLIEFHYSDVKHDKDES